MSRLDARGTLSLDDYRAAMEGVYSTSVSERTIDEAPGAYKPIDDIIGPIAKSVDIVDVIGPISDGVALAVGQPPFDTATFTASYGFAPIRRLIVE